MLTMTDKPVWTKESFYEEFREPFASIARKANWSGSGADDLDLEQWLWMHFFEVWDKAQLWNRAIVLTHAGKRAKEHARQERIDYENFRVSFVYTTALVDGYLREAVWCEPAHCPDVHARADIAMAFARLNKNRQQVIFRFYALGEVYDRSAPEERTRWRALREMTESLNMSLTPVNVEDTEWSSN